MSPDVILWGLLANQLPSEPVSVTEKTRNKDTVPQGNVATLEGADRTVC